MCASQLHTSAQITNPTGPTWTTCMTRPRSLTWYHHPQAVCALDTILPSFFELPFQGSHQLRFDPSPSACTHVHAHPPATNLACSVWDRAERKNKSRPSVQPPLTTPFPSNYTTHLRKAHYEPVHKTHSLSEAPPVFASNRPQTAQLDALLLGCAQARHRWSDKVQTGATSSQLDVHNHRPQKPNWCE